VRRRDVAAQLAELAGFFLVAIGICLLVYGAALLSVPLAYLVGGVLTAFLGAAVILLANRRTAA
jgi:hypothetical protein